MSLSFESISIVQILFLIISINPICAKNFNECVDTVRWKDRINNFTCADYVNRRWCVNRTVITSLQKQSSRFDCPPIPPLLYASSEIDLNLICLRSMDQVMCLSLVHQFMSWILGTSECKNGQEISPIQ